MARTSRMMRPHARRRWALLALALAGAVLLRALWLNAPYLDEWAHYAALAVRFEERPAHPLNCGQPDWALFCRLSGAGTAQREALLMQEVAALRLAPMRVPIRGAASNVVVVFGPQPGEPFTVFSAHYDKKGDLPAALDNTAGVYSLYLLLKNLSAAPPSRNAVVSFSGEEETGFYGAMALLGWMRERQMAIDSVLAIDSIGRGHPYTGAMGQGGGLYYRNIWGRERRWSPWGRRVYPYVEPDANLSRRLAAAAKEAGVSFRTYDRMVGWSEDLLFAMEGHSTARLYGDDWWYYFHYIDTPNDRPEFIDTEQLQEFVQLYLAYLSLEKK